MQAKIRAKAPDLRVRRNYPYVGYADGLTTYLRTRFAAKLYAGLEIEINQSEKTAARLKRVMTVLQLSLRGEI